MLPINFHKTFIPERNLISALLQYTARGGEGDYQEISADTGIPMGKVNGKVPAIMDYARGMGLIEVENLPQSKKRPRLTDFGRVVYMEDGTLGEEIVQWLLHLNLCRSDHGALVWHQTFAQSRRSLGSSFSKEQLEKYLCESFGEGRNRTGPMLLAYGDDAALKRCGAVFLDGETVVRRKAPLLDAFALPYSALFLHLMQQFCPGQNQVTITDFDAATRIFDICLWNETDIERALNLIEKKGCINIDRQMHPWILEKRTAAENVWDRIFDDLT